MMAELEKKFKFYSVNVSYFCVSVIKFCSLGLIAHILSLVILYNKGLCLGTWKEDPNQQLPQF